MDPAKIQKCEIGLPSKIPKYELIQPGALAKGLGKSLKSMGTLRVNAEQRSPIAKNRSYNTSTSKLNMLADKNFLMHPSFAEMEDNDTLNLKEEVARYGKRSNTGPFESTKGTKVVEIAQDAERSGSPFVSKKTNNVVETTRYAGRSLFEYEKRTKVVEISRDAQRSQSPFVSKKAKNMVEATRYAERSLFEYEKTKNLAETDRDAKKSRVESKKAKEVVEVTQDAQRSDLIDYGKAKKVNEVSQDAQKVNNVSRFSGPSEFEKAKKVVETIRVAEKSPVESEKANEVAEVTRDAQRNETSLYESEKTKKVRGMNICKKVLRLRPGEKLRVSFYQNRVVGENQSSFSRHLGLLVRDRNMCPLRVHSWDEIEEHKREHMWAAVTKNLTVMT